MCRLGGDWQRNCRLQFGKISQDALPESWVLPGFDRQREVGIEF